jgi:hypothetical protein
MNALLGSPARRFELVAGGGPYRRAGRRQCKVGPRAKNGAKNGQSATRSGADTVAEPVAARSGTATVLPRPVAAVTVARRDRDCRLWAPAKAQWSEVWTSESKVFAFS